MRKPTLRSRLDGVFNVLGFNHRKSRKAIKSSRRTLAVEPLECRQLLSVAPLGNEALVNSLVAGTQRLYETGNAVAAGPNGSYVTTWTSANQDGDGLGVYGQRFDAVGGTLGSEFRANTTTVHNQQRSSVATAADGSFVVVWDSSGQDGDDTGVYGQRYAANGATLGGEFRVNVTTDGSQENAAVACLTDGGFVVVWNGKGAGDNSGVFGRRYDSSGTAVGGEFLINAHTDDQQRYATVAALPDGGFLAAWESHGGQDGDGSGIYAQRFSADGSHVGGEFLVNTTTAHQQQYPAIGVAADGQFTIAWQSSLQDGSGWGVYAQRYQANGQTQGGEFRANSYTTDDQSHPSVAYNHRGGFVIAWNGKGTGDSNGVFVREFGADGAALGSEALVNGTTDDAQRFPTVVAAGSGYVMAWSGDGVGDSDGVFVRRLGSRPTTSGITDESVWAGRSESNIDLWSAFEDAESADSMLTYQVTANSNPDLFSSITIDAATGRLTLGYALGALGSADLTVQAMDPSGLSVETTFVATVAVPEDDPYLWYFPRNGNHVWDTTTQNWNTAADGSGDWRAWPNNASWSAAFGRSADTVTVASDITAGVVTFDVAGYTLNGGSIKLAGTGSTINAANAGGTINSNITVTTDNQEWTVWSGKQLTLGGTVTFSTKTVYIEGGGTAAFTGSTTHNGLSLRIRDGVTAAFSAGSLHVSSLYVGYGSTGTLNWNSSG
ncbi:MAG: hypothetical protein LLG00_00015, partial [Planctomycetaceae bacterium]|nr:hypothetical protein [Planctomycetaceae bacterium]